MSPTAREQAVQAEGAHLPTGPGERFAGYGIMGLPFVSGHVLAMRRFFASSVGPGYTSVWHRNPAGKWSFYTDTEPMQSCNRYFGEAITEAVVTPIEVTWPADDRIEVRISGVVEWESRLEQDATARVMSALGRRMPDALWRAAPVLSAMSAVGSRLLAAGKINLEGTAPNGQHFIANPKLIWLIAESRAMVRGIDLGSPGPLAEQARLGDFYIPQRGIFAIGTAVFDAFDPARHRAIPTKEGKPATAPSGGPEHVQPPG